MAESDVREILDARRQIGVWRNRFAALLDRTPVPTAVCLSDGTLTDVNPALAGLLGSTPGRLRERNITDLLRPKVQRDYDRVIEDLRARRHASRELPVRWPGGSGELTVHAVADDVWVGLLLTLRPNPVRGGEAPALTDREAEVLRLIAGGATSARVAAELGLTADGVNYHLTRLTDRLGVPNRVALIARAYTLGLLDPAAWPPR
ncbi:LuxR C-terminal-related transcriptional regulator [Amycolatopsis sp. H20-H5]|uniref:LuxR C-terminal-related transcriptional regulator n=1 Tax=Amycolatopsis sp. H20-H5 TaxID=3046309 RepID=UPI002DB7DB8D|nr:LuxR C-terminal-related transcriptional regulator [Amycolatopsis sp. H20-H5]MEC3977292.1 LuxR C-terminal-related transcriptional regulator [Amycolatopsis sp. H20-H5]